MKLDIGHDLFQWGLNWRIKRSGSSLFFTPFSSVKTPSYLNVPEEQEQAQVTHEF